MTKENDEMLKRIIDDDAPERTPEQRLREAASRWFEGRKNLYLIWSTLQTVVGIALAIRGATLLYAGLSAERTEMIANGSLLAMLGIAVLFFDKLWYKIASNNASILQQLLLVRSELGQLRRERSADLPEADLPADLPPEFLETFRGRVASLWSRLSNRTVRWISVGVVIAATCVLAATLSGYPSSRDISQVDEWTFAPGGTVVARSRIRFERSPASGRFVTLALPYPTGEITSVTADGRALRYSKLDWRTYEVELPIGPFPWQPPEVLVTWQFPVDELAPVEGGYRTTLSALLPVNFYRLEVLADEESGYKVAGEPENGRLVPFYSGTWDDRSFFGSCQISLRKKAN